MSTLETEETGLFGATTPRQPPAPLPPGKRWTTDPIERRWNGMRSRCWSKQPSVYKHYGARGITVCQRWTDSFEAFRDDMGPMPTPMHSLDRIDNDKGYWCGKCPHCHAMGQTNSNCRWATRAEQARNTSATLWVEIDGERRKLCDVAEETGLKPQTILNRIEAGWGSKAIVRKLALPDRGRDVRPQDVTIGRLRVADRAAASCPLTDQIVRSPGVTTGPLFWRVLGIAIHAQAQVGWNAGFRMTIPLLATVTNEPVEKCRLAIKWCYHTDALRSAKGNDGTTGEVMVADRYKPLVDAIVSGEAWPSISDVLEKPVLSFSHDEMPISAPLVPQRSPPTPFQRRPAGPNRVLRTRRHT